MADPVEDAIRAGTEAAAARKAGADDLAATLAAAVANLDAYLDTADAATPAAVRTHVKYLTQVVRRLLIRLNQLG